MVNPLPDLFSALATLLTWGPLLALVGGVLIGLISGAMPGTGLAGLFILIGFAYGLDPSIGIPLAIGAIVPISTTDVIPAVLIGVPGSGSSQAVILDGHQLAKQGRAGEALASTYAASLIGGFVGTSILIVTVPLARPILRLLRSPEFLAVAIIGLLLVAVLSRGSAKKGVVSAILGVIIASIGLDPSFGRERLTFGIEYLEMGVPIIPFMIGLFAIPAFAELLSKGEAIAGSNPGLGAVTGQRMIGIRAALRSWRLIFKSSGIGSVIGMMPGVGLGVVDWLVYGYARQSERGADKTFGRGDIRGVIAPGAADNATLASSFVPALVFGIPGGITVAIFLGFLVVMGVTPGPDLISERLDLVYLIIVSIAVANLIAAGIALWATPLIARIALMSPHVLFPVSLVIFILASYQARNHVGDIVVLMVIGALGSLMYVAQWPRVPMIIGYILAPILERYLRLTIQAYGWSSLGRWTFWALIVLGVGSLFVFVGGQRSKALIPEEAD